MTSPYLLQALQSMQQPQGMTPQTAALNLGAQAVNQYAQGRHQRMQQQNLNNLNQQLGVGASSPYQDLGTPGMTPVPDGMMNPTLSTQPMGQNQNQFGGLYGLGQKLKGLFSGG